jgi:Flp pilus assembly protein TadG
MIEIALSLSAFLLLTLGVMEFAMAVYAFNFCNYISGEAARWASVRGSQYVAAGNTAITNTDVTNYVKSQAVGFDSSKLSVSTCWTTSPTTSGGCDGATTPGSIVQVNVGYTIVPLVGLAIKQNIQVSNTAQVAIVH